MTPARKELLLLLGEISHFYPEMRLGQILSWFASTALGQVDGTYDVEDEQLIAAIREHIANPLARTAADIPYVHRHVDADSVLRELEEQQKRFDKEREEE